MVARVAVALVALLVAAPAAIAEDRISFPGDDAGWSPRTVTGSSATVVPDLVFEQGPATPPLGLGSLEFRIGDDGGSAAEIRNSDYAGVRLDEITAFSYSTYTDVDGSGDQAPYLIVHVDHDANPATSADLLFFEPVYQNGFTTDVPTQPDLVDDTWQTWNARTGGWYSAFGNAGSGPGASVVTLDEYISAFPNAEIVNTSAFGGVRIVTGFGAGAWNGYVGNVDNVAIATNDFGDRWDFEADTDDDGAADSADNCAALANPDQADTDNDEEGDACDGNDDGDGLADGSDNCPTVFSGDQTNTDGDAQGDVCDADDDNDGISDAAEAAIGTSSTDPDADDDGVNDSADACPKTAGAQPSGCPADTPEDAPPTVQFTAPAANSTVRQTGRTLAANASDDRGVISVSFVDADGVICTDTTAPYACTYMPSGDDVGKNTLIAVATDGAGQTGTAVRRVNVARFTPGRVAPRRDTSSPYRFTLSGRFALPNGVTAEQGCRGTVVLRITRGRRSAGATNAPLRRDCTYRRAVAVGAVHEGALRARARFNGNAVLLPRSSRTVALRAG